MTSRAHFGPCGIVLLMLGAGLVAWPRAAAGQGAGRAGVEPLVLGADRNEAWFATFAPDGKTLATGGAGAIVKFWDAASGRQKTAGETSSEGLQRAAAFSPDGKVLVTGHSTGALTLWETTGGNAWKSLNGQHSESIRWVVFSPDGKLLVTAGQDRKVNVWDTASWTVVRSLADLPQPVLCSAISPDGKLLAVALGNPLAVAGAGGLRLYDLATLELRLEFSELKSTVFSVAFAPDGKTLATGSGMSLRLWDPNTGEPRAALDVTHMVRIVAFSPDGKLLLSAGKENTGGGGDGAPDKGVGLVWDLSTLRPKAVIKGHGRQIMGVAFSPDGRLLATTSVYAPQVRIWQVAKLPAPPPPNANRNARSVSSPRRSSSSRPILRRAPPIR